MEYGVSQSFDCQLLYFTSSSCLKDNKGLVFIGEENGNPNVYYKDYVAGEVRRLSNNTEGTLKSYVYFNGTEHKGFGKASACLDQNRELVYYLQGRDICQVELDRIYGLCEGCIARQNSDDKKKMLEVFHIKCRFSYLLFPVPDTTSGTWQNISWTTLLTQSLILPE